MATKGTVKKRGKSKTAAMPAIEGPGHDAEVPPQLEADDADGKNDDSENEDEEPSDAPATARGLSFADFASPRAARGGSLLPALADEVRREKMEYAALFS